MKKIITIVISIYLFFMFLVYSGVFRNYSDPFDVVNYYLECMKNREGFLTYQISKSVFFNPDKNGSLYIKYKMGDATKIKLNIKEKNDKYCYVQAKIIHKNYPTDNLLLKLEKFDNIWKICELKEVK